MVKQAISHIFLALLFSCSPSKNQDAPGDKYLGIWHMEQIKSPKYPYYIYNYYIQKNAEAFVVKILVSCPKCGNPQKYEKNYTYSGTYNQEKSVFEIQKDGFQEILTINEADSSLISSRFPKFLFTKIK